MKIAFYTYRIVLPHHKMTQIPPTTVNCRSLLVSTTVNCDVDKIVTRKGGLNCDPLKNYPAT